MLIYYKALLGRSILKQLLILSGKGGTGKTTMASALIKLSQAKKFADCDVDAPNLHLVMDQTHSPERKDFYGLNKAKIDEDQCQKCGLCEEHCHFGAILYDKKEQSFRVNAFACEGCSVCQYVCPHDAITLEPSVVGDLMLYRNSRAFSTAQLRMGSGNSGLLVTEVKKRMNVKEIESDLAIIDGSPGIGCPVMASITGVDMILIVAEPSASGISDLERVISTAKHFNTPVAICVNKYDINLGLTKKIEDRCMELKLPFVGKIPFGQEAVKLVNQGLTIVDEPCEAGKSATIIYENTLKLLQLI